MRRRSFIAGLSAVATTSTIASAKHSLSTTRFAVIADSPYSPFEAIQVQRMIERLNSLPLDCVIHLGDIKSSQDHCTQALLIDRAELFTQVKAPFFYTPGDNDWTDCRRHPKTAVNITSPIDAKAMLLQQWFGSRDSTARRGDHALSVRRQSSQVENARWHVASTLFTLLHVVSSNDNAGFDSVNDAEQQQRQLNNLAWLSESFELAAEADVTHMAIGFHVSMNFSAPSKVYAPFLQALRDGAKRLQKPVLIMHGDTHKQRIDNALGLPNTTRLEAFGSSIVNYVLVEPSESRSRPWIFSLGDMPSVLASDGG
jgi:hypothetical protein